FPIFLHKKVVRMNRKDSSFAATSSLKGGRKSVSKPKKFVSRSEELCDWMASLGYQLPKNVQPEHFEYVFHNEDTARIVKQMMKVIKTENILDPVEIAKFDQLKKDGRVLYGSELEVHFDRIKAIKIDRAMKEQATIEKDRKLDQMIAEKEREIVQWKAMDKSLDDQLLAAEFDEAAAKNKAAFENMESEKLNKEILAKQQELIQLSNVLMEKLKSVHLKLSSGDKNKTTVRLCDNDNTWFQMLENEERLSMTIKSMYDKFGDEQGFGFGNGHLNPEFTHVAYRMFKQQENHLERLRHEIIHEKLREIEMDIEMAGIKKVLQSMGDIVVEAKLLFHAEPDIRDRMVQNTKECSDTFDTILRREQSLLKDTTKEDTAFRLESQIKELVDIKSCAKKERQDLMCFLVNTLVGQRVRVDVIRELFLAEKLKNEKLIWFLQEYRNSMFDLAKQEELLQNELTGSPSIDPEIAAALEKYKIPSSAYQNPQTTYQTLCLLKSLKETEKFSHLADGQQVTHLCQQVDHLQSLVKNVKFKVHGKSTFEESIASLESIHDEMEKNLRLHEQNKARRAKENVAQMLNQISQVADFLSELEATPGIVNYRY
ncbi:unnamed protein product, partial [Allacma fusca]